MEILEVVVKLAGFAADGLTGEKLDKSKSKWAWIVVWLLLLVLFIFTLLNS
jgi:uncharacterized integral membrane protein